MAHLMENVKTINSAVRTLLLTLALAGLGGAGYWGYLEYSKRDRLLATQEMELRTTNAKLNSLQAELASQVTENENLRQEMDKLQTALHLLKTDQRLARINVIAIERNDKGRAISSELEFVELSPDGDTLSSPKRIKLPGDVVYIDNWIVKFDDSYTEKGDIERGTSLCLFRRIFSEEQSPNEGYSLDEVGMRPQAYARGGRLSDFEKRLWSDFWEFSNDGKKASEMGIRAANGEAVSVKVREGKSYAITLRASDGLSIKPIADSLASETQVDRPKTDRPSTKQTSLAPPQSETQADSLPTRTARATQQTDAPGTLDVPVENLNSENDIDKTQPIPVDDGSKTKEPTKTGDQ